MSKLDLDMGGYMCLSRTKRLAYMIECMEAQFYENSYA